jgi:hypothetical protein
VLVTHGAIAHFLTEDWDVEDPMIGTAYKNCSSTPRYFEAFRLIEIGEHREFDFTSASTAEDAHVAETQSSRARRGPRGPESDPHVLDEMKTLQNEAKDKRT